MRNSVAQFKVGKVNVEIFASRQAMGEAAAQDAAQAIKRLAEQQETVPVMFATGASQLETLRTLTSMRDLPWEKVVGFHMDEYPMLGDQHPASFRRYLRENLTSKVRMRQFYGLDPDTGGAEEACRRYADLLRRYPPQLCLFGIGENGHLAFNDPAEADFNDPKDVKIVHLDRACRQQQLAEGWFKSFDEVPETAITVTIPALLRIPQLIASVPGPRKAQIVKRTLTQRISTEIPATILREHPNATIYLDPESAAQLGTPKKVANR
jgi:glucosamine-6-phosphate deaminase